MSGKLYEHLTGKTITTSTSLIEIEQATEEFLGRPLKVEEMRSRLVTEGGNVFGYSRTMLDHLEERIDRLMPKPE